MTAIRVKLDFRGFATYLQKLGQEFAPAVARGLQSGAARSIPIVQRATVEADPASPNGSVGAFDVGKFWASWRSESKPNGARIFNVDPKAPIIERGRRRGRKPPPLKVIEEWARRKMGLTAEQARAAAWPISRAIAKRGLKGRHILRKAAPEIIAACRIEIRSELDATLARIRAAAKAAKGRKS